VSRPAAIGVALAVLALSGCGGGGTLSKEDLQKKFEAIQSLAAEGALVADGAADGRTTETFVSVHAQYLSEAAGQIQKDVSAAGGPSEKRGAERLASLVSQDLDELHREPDDRALAARLRERFELYAAAAEKRARR
jgi:hypothetical protein